MPIGQRKMMKNAVECIWVSFECIVWLYVSVSFCVCVCEILEWIWMVGWWSLVWVSARVQVEAGELGSVSCAKWNRITESQKQPSYAIVSYHDSWRMKRLIKPCNICNTPPSRSPAFRTDRWNVLESITQHVLNCLFFIYSQILKSLVLVFWPGLPDLAILCIFMLFWCFRMGKLVCPGPNAHE